MATADNKKRPQSSEDGKEPRYLTTQKKHYYLASVDENVQVLIKEQVDDLTKVLIDLKSQYDKLKRETETKRKDTDLLNKKIKILEEMDKKAKKKIESSNQAAENLKATIEAKRSKLEEENYQRKTLLTQIEKLKNDILLTKKNITIKEGQSKLLNKNYEKERHKENALKEQLNAIHSKIERQDRQNIFDKDEQELQIKYYNTIIDQKNLFIKSADERKERQRKIAQEAKNNTQDKQEIKLRQEIGYLQLYNKYLRVRMERELNENEKLEETYRKIRDICGTANLKLLVEIILLKEKKYNDHVAKVEEHENMIEVYDKDIAELETQLVELKNEVLVKEAENEKTISTIPTSVVEENETHLIKEETELKNTLFLLQEKSKDINLIYEKILENMKFLANSIKRQASNKTTPQPVITEEEEKEKVNKTNPIESEENKNQVIASNEVLLYEKEELTESKQIKAKFSEFLNEIKKKCDGIFLCKTKQDFLMFIKEKGIQIQNAVVETKNIKRQSIRRPTFKKEIKIDDKANQTATANATVQHDELEMEEDTNESEDQYIFNTFQINMRNKTNDFIKKENKKKVIN